MTTPIRDFLRDYQRKGTARFHMPGHKGRGPLGCEAWDLTEIPGADSLHEAAGIIARSEENAAALFGSAATFYSTEGASQCVKAMLFLALQRRRAGTPPVILADEPTGNLDKKSSGEVMEILRGLWQEGRTVILITHDPKIADSARRVVTISDGKIVSDERRAAAVTPCTAP